MDPFVPFLIWPQMWSLGAATFILNCSTLKLKLHKVSWGHVGSCYVCVHIGSCGVCDHGFCLCDHAKSRLAQDLTQAVMVYSVMRLNLFSFNFLIKWFLNVPIWMAGNPLGNVFLYSPSYPFVGIFCMPICLTVAEYDWYESLFCFH